MYKREFTKIVDEICGRNNWKLETMCDEWVLLITNSNNTKITIIGYSFPLNSHTAAIIANDKGLTNDFLELAGIPHIQNTFIYGDDLRIKTNVKSTLEEDVDKYLENHSLPVVVKPCRGQGGQDVELCISKDQVVEHARSIAKNDAVCLSMFEESEFETRLFMLDSVALFAYRKRRTTDWKHNLSTGALPEVVDLKNTPEIVEIAQRTMQALGIRTATVDVFETKEGYKILEVNNGISMAHFSKSSIENLEIALNIYEKYIAESFKSAC